MRAKIATLLIAFLSLTLPLLPTAGAEAAKPKKPSVTIGFLTKDYTTSDNPKVVYGYKHRPDHTKLQLQVLTGGKWEKVTGLPVGSGAHGSGDKYLGPLPLGIHNLRVVLLQKGKVLAKAATSIRVFGPVSFAALLKSASYPHEGDVRSGSEVIGTQSFVYEFAGFIGYANWRTLLKFTKTSCTSFSMALGAKGAGSDVKLHTRAVLATGVAASADISMDTIGGLQFSTTLGSPATIELSESNAAIGFNYFGTGTAFCYTANGEA